LIAVAPEGVGEFGEKCHARGLAPNAASRRLRFPERAGVPAVGVAKNAMAGTLSEPAGEPWLKVLKLKGRHVGFEVALAGRAYVSAGHLVTQQKALELYLKFRGSHRLPEPLFEAHRRAEELKKQQSFMLN